MHFIVNTSAIDCLETLVSEMTYYVSSGTLKSSHSLRYSVKAVVLLNNLPFTKNPQYMGHIQWLKYHRSRTQENAVPHLRFLLKAFPHIKFPKDAGER